MKVNWLYFYDIHKKLECLHDLKEVGDKFIVSTVKREKSWKLLILRFITFKATMFSLSTRKNSIVANSLSINCTCSNQMHHIIVISNNHAQLSISIVTIDWKNMVQKQFAVPIESKLANNFFNVLQYNST
jgi:hypothetical protein